MTVHAKSNIQLNTIPANTSLLGGHFVYYQGDSGPNPSTVASANVVQTPSLNPSNWGFNTHIGSNGIQLRYNTDVLSEWTRSWLKFYNPDTHLVNVLLDSNGLTVSKGGIVGGDVDSSGFIYLSTEDYPLKDDTTGTPGITINNFTPTAEGTDGRLVDDYAWREVVGINFGVTSDGSLYASNVSVSGAITATSLTIQGGSGSSTYVYDGNSAINAAGYSIEIINDINAAPGDTIIDPSIQTYLYPILYLNGVDITDTAIKTQFV